LKKKHPNSKEKRRAQIIIYLNLFPRTVWIIKIILKAVIKMHSYAFIPDIKVMLTQVMAWDFVTVAAHYCFTSKRKLDSVTVGKFKSSVHGFNL